MIAIYCKEERSIHSSNWSREEHAFSYVLFSYAAYWLVSNMHFVLFHPNVQFPYSCTLACFDPMCSSHIAALWPVLTQCAVPI